MRLVDVFNCRVEKGRKGNSMCITDILYILHMEESLACSKIKEKMDKITLMFNNLYLELLRRI